MQRGLEGLEIISTDLKVHTSLFKHIYFYVIKLSQLKENINLYVFIW